MAPSGFRALVVDRDGERVTLAERTWTLDQLLPGEVTIRVAYSSVNYKDGLAVRADGRVARRYPLVPGIDLSGTVLESADPRLGPGQEVVAHGFDLGVSHHGGLAEIARVPAAWVLPLPKGMTLREAMAIGTAGYTAALCVERLERGGVRPAAGPVIVTGASGGVGSVAVDLLAARGYRVVASTGKDGARERLRRLGAEEVIGREETSAASTRPLEHARWAAAIDTVGGSTFAFLLRTMSYGATIAITGNTGGIRVETTVLPFILRAVNVLGVESVRTPMPERAAVWRRLATDLRPRHLEEMTTEVPLGEVAAALDSVVRGGLWGRTVVRVGGEPAA
ncbi:MAG: acryloyl-CoA reductase [Chloroflexota bacterium]|nr:acryloyl-CoA reductase [Chloroflexota bacterium]